MKTLGIRHVALNVKDPQKSKKFYQDVMGMTVEWEPDPENIYLTSESQDNLALHKASGDEKLDHIGYIVPREADVDEWASRVRKSAKILKEPKTHRDGARSFYFEDPDGITVQVIYHPPISGQA